MSLPDIDLRLSIKDDYLVADNLVKLILTHRGGQEVDFDKRTLNSEKTVTTIEGCLVRMKSDRYSESNRQVRETGKSIAQDHIEFVDTEITIPRLDGIAIEIMDNLTDLAGKVWQVLAIDKATLDTRWVLGCRSL